MIIDAHGHVTGPQEMYDYFRGLASVSGAAQRPKRPEIADERVEESIQEHLAEVRAVGTDLQLISPRPWAVPTGDRREAVVAEITRMSNDMIEACCRLHPEFFRGVAALPQAAGSNAKHWLEELGRCVTELGFVGCKINPDPGEGSLETPDLGSEYWYPLYEKMVEFDVPGLIHGGPFRFSREPELGYFITEETVAAFALLRSRVFQDFPTLKLIVGHGGGYLPYQVGRARGFRLNEIARDPTKEDFDTSMSRLYFDTVLYNPESLDLLFRVAGIANCVFGSDKPANGSVIDPKTGRALNDIVPMIDGLPWLSDKDKEAIYEGNARRLYSRLK